MKAVFWILAVGALASAAMAATLSRAADPSALDASKRKGTPEGGRSSGSSPSSPAEAAR